jgi:hypothetical protein
LCLSGYSEDPDYQFIKDLFKDLFDSLGFTDVDNFKWKDEHKYMLPAIEGGGGSIKIEDTSPSGSAAKD